MGLFSKRNDEPLPQITVAPLSPERVAAVAEIDRKLHALALIQPCYRAPAASAQIDELLDLRNAIRPARVVRPSAPVVPGTSS